jgi:hypothetical protein
MRKIGKKQEKEQSAPSQLRFPFHGLAREALWDTAVLSGFGFVQDELEAKRTVVVWRALCASGAAAGSTRGPGAQLIGAGRAASRDPSSARSEH